MWLLLLCGLAGADSGDSADSGDTDPYQDTAFVAAPTYTQTSRGCGGTKAGAVVLLGAALTRFARGAGRSGERRASPPARRPTG